MANAAAIPEEDPLYYIDRVIVVLPEPQIAANIAKDDIVKMYVEILGTFEYENLLGGQMVVPQFRANILELVSP